MNHLSRIALIALCWISLGGFNPSVAQTPITPPAATPSDTRSQGWKSCAEQLNSHGDSSITSLQARFERPQNISQMLQNLKLAWENDWLLQPEFFDAATLRKFFNGTEVNFKQRDNVPSSIETFVVEADSSVFSKMSVVLEATCSSRSFPQPNGKTKTILTAIGNLHIYGRPVPELTLASIRQVLGPETQNAIDHDFAAGGSEYPPANKGSVTYADRAKEKLEGQKMGLTFYFTVPPKFPDSLQREIAADDTVQGIVLADQRHQTQEN